MVDFSDIQGWMGVLRDAVSLLRQGRDLLPSGPKRDEIEAKIRQIEEAMARSDARLAKDLGYPLCECTFPPQIMLWKEQQRAHVCPNPVCGRVVEEAKAYANEASYYSDGV